MCYSNTIKIINCVFCHTSIGYKQSDDGIWSPVYASDEDTLFTGNTDRNSIAENWFRTPIIAKTIRLYPEDFFTRPALRWDLYGCG